MGQLETHLIGAQYLTARQYMYFTAAWSHLPGQTAVESHSQNPGTRRHGRKKKREKENINQRRITTNQDAAGRANRGSDLCYCFDIPLNYNGRWWIRVLAARTEEHRGNKSTFQKSTYPTSLTSTSTSPTLSFSHNTAMARLRRARYLSCFYCGRRTSIVFDGSVHQFTCSSCDATNYLDKVPFLF